MTLSCIEITPPAQPVGSIIWLHGLGADGNDFAPLVPQLNLPSSLPIRFVFPNAPQKPVTINNGYVMPAWYDIFAIGIDQRIDEAGIAASVNAIEQLIEKEEQRGIPLEKIVLAGFSQGAVIALTTGLRSLKKLGGIMALSGYLPHPEKCVSTANRSLPIFIAHGTQDTVVPFFLGQAVYDFLKKQDHNVSWHTYNMAHSVCEQEIQDIGKWIARTLS